MSSKQPKSEKRALSLARKIVQHMHDEKLQAGERYFSEAEALDYYGVARGTLREALRYLQIQGVIEIRPGPNGGHFVAQPNWEHLASTIGLLLQFTGSSLHQLLEARSYIDPSMARMAAANAKAADIKQLDEMLEAIADNLGDYDGYHQAYMGFWDTLAACTKNALFMKLSPALRRITTASAFRPSELQREDVLKLMTKVRNAVAEKNKDKAAKAMEEYERRFIKVMQRDYPRELKKNITWTAY